MYAKYAIAPMRARLSLGAALSAEAGAVFASSSAFAGATSASAWAGIGSEGEPFAAPATDVARLAGRGLAEHAARTIGPIRSARFRGRRIANVGNATASGGPTTSTYTA